MLTDPLRKWLWDARRSVIVWALAIALVGGFYASFWPSVDSPELQEAIDAYPQGLMEAMDFTDIGTAAGYLNASVYGLIGPVLLLVYAVTAGTGAIAGDEAAGRLDLIAAHPLSRRRLALQRVAAVLVSIGVVVGALFLAILGLTGPADLAGISVAHLGAMHLHLFSFGALFGSLAYAVGAGTGDRSAALGTSAAVAVVGYVTNGVLPQVDGLQWTENLSPFHWLNGDDPLRTGLAVDAVLVMAGLALGLVVAGTWFFDRRDIAV